MKDYGRTRSTIKPNELEVTESKVFVATNITEIQVDDPVNDGEEQTTHTEYEYNLVEYESSEYIELMHTEQQEQDDELYNQRADIDFIAMETGVELEV